MKKALMLIMVFTFLFSCDNNLEFNSPAFQGDKNYTYWKSDRLRAGFLENGGIKIIGVNNKEALSFTLSNFEEGIYNLGSSFNNRAVFEDFNLISYSTSNNGDGNVTVTNYDEVNLTISGTFSFNAYSVEGEQVNFINGVFFQIPIDALEGQNQVLTGTNTLEVTINEIPAQVLNVETDILDGVLTVTGINADNSTIQIIMPESTLQGSYTLNETSFTYANYIFPDGTVDSSQYGTLIILEHDTQFDKIKGSFLFNTGFPHQTVVTGGNFIVYY